jgi:hypothetical protein
MSSDLTAKLKHGQTVGVAGMIGQFSFDGDAGNLFVTVILTDASTTP